MIVMRDYQGEIFVRQDLRSHVSLCKVYTQMKTQASIYIT